MRRAALEILLDVERGAFATDVFDRVADAHSLSARGRRFVRELVLGVLRRQLTLDTILDAFGRRPTAELEAPVRLALRIGVHQLVFLDGVPAHAAVSESVALVDGGARGYVNAVLRAFMRESHRVPPARDRGGASPRRRFERAGRSVTFFSRDIFADPETAPTLHLAQTLSFPELLVRRWVEHVGLDEARARMEAAIRPRAIHLRPRADGPGARTLAERLAREDGVVVALVEREGRTPMLRVERGAERVFTSRAWRRGMCAVQDPEQTDAVEILAPHAGEVVWDVCAAPGGKTLQLAERLAPTGGRVVATDRDARRLERVHETLARTGLGEGVDVAVHDGTSVDPPPGKPERGFDAILLDAPCSNTAVLGRRPEARWRLREHTFERMAALQRTLIDATRTHLAPGGRLILSTCSLEPEEGAGHGLEPTASPMVWLARAEGR